MTELQFMLSWWFWGPVLVLALIFIGLVKWEEHKIGTCPTCFSKRKYHRGPVEYWEGEYRPVIEACQDEWHDTNVDPWS